MTRIEPTYVEQLQSLVERYRAAGQPWPATMRETALWAIDRRLWAPHPSAFVDRLAEDLARACREEYYLDPQGRKVRAKHAARVVRDGKQLVLWDDGRTGSPGHMQIAFRQRREQIVGDCYQLKLDVDSYNENRKPIAPIQLVLDFRRDVEERSLEGHD